MHNSRVNLNKAQQQAVAAQNGPVLVVAGAGTGKTSVLVSRITRLIADGTPAKRILALTFTEKAAAEMQDRVNNALSTIHSDLPLLTFNAFGESLLRKYASDIGLGRNFKLIGENAQIVFLRERLDQLNLDYFSPISSPDSQLANLSDYFSKLKQNVITPDMYTSFAAKMSVRDDAEKLEKIKHEELARVYATYIALMKEAGVIDYDDQIFLAIDLLRTRPNVLKDVQGSYDFVHVDEFQDTNTMQSVLVDMLVGPNQNLFVVGDDDQSIYGWRGATLANILDFKERYPRAHDITLVENYRSSNEILNAAYTLIQNNNPHRLEAQLKIDKKLRGQKTGSKPSVCSFETIDEELSWLAESIQYHIDNGVEPGNIAVLARRNNTLDRIHTQLELSNIEHVVIGQRFELYKEPIIRHIIETLRTIVDPLDDTSLYHTLTGPFFNQPIHPLNELASLARRSQNNLASTIESSEASELRASLAQIQSWAEDAKNNSITQIAFNILKESGYWDNLRQSPEDFGRAGQTLNDYFQTLREFENIAILPSPLQYVESLPALQSAGESLEDGTLELSGTQVNVLSIHKSKGLEWPIVYIVDCTEGSFPLKARPGGIQLPQGIKQGTETEADDHMYEERRLMYVAMTRAKNELTLTYSQRHTNSSVRKPSRFIAEVFQQEDVTTASSREKPEISAGIHPSTADKPVVIPASILHNNKVELTVSQIKTYLDCPLDFYYKYVLCVPREQGFSQAYGTLMHTLLEEINHSISKGELINYESLEATLISEWPVYGHLSAAQRERSLTHAKSVLKRLYETISAHPRVPISIEEGFKINLPQYGLTVRGRFDAVFALGNSVEIVDYKTSSSVDTPEKAKSRASASEQLTLYALAWQSQHDELPALVTLDFIDTGQRGSLKKTQKGIDGAMTRLQKVSDGIRSNHFPLGREHRFCIHPQ